MFTVVLIFHILVSIGLILVVLMQSAKGEGLAGSALGGGSGLSGAVFGGRGAASFLSKATTVLAILFMVNCGALAFMSAGGRTDATSMTAPTESAVTRGATEDLARRMEQQSQQMQTNPDSVFNIDVEPGAASDQDTGSAGGQ